ncbi:hypothetical protein F5144DRAFT_627466 [Chaetomium tenue]|uniref:Uncharacterized protein n=1 Tax=Chaetomium tenue TaxID=1854479 RepID=A0ACB7PK98_9PEZI|nr:hypothetical protein F5144DRAFT_627466 [Chaetomium globosum]
MRKGRPAISHLFSLRFPFHPSCRNSPARAFGSPATFLDVKSQQYILRPRQYSAHLAASDHSDHLPVSNVRPASSADNRRVQKTQSKPHRCQAPQDFSAPPSEHRGFSCRSREPKQNPTRSSSFVEQASPSLQSTQMDQNQPWDWRQRGQGEYIPPPPNGPNPFGMPFSMPPNFNPGWTQPALQNPFPQPGQPQQQNGGRGWGGYGAFGLPGLPGPLFQATHQQNNGRDQSHMPFGRVGDQRYLPQGNQPPSHNDGRGHSQAQASQPTSWNPFQTSQPRQQDYGRRQGEGDFYRPLPQLAAPQPNPQNQQGGDGASGGRKRQRSRRNERQRNPRSPRPQRATPPDWVFPPENAPLPFPMDSPATGPFRPTRPAQRNTPGISWNGSRIKRSDMPTISWSGTKKNKVKQKHYPQYIPPIAAELQAIGLGRRDPITDPSLASGGVPDPTDEYLQRASFMPYRLAAPKPMLVVIDLNGTLLYRPNKRQATTFVERQLARTFLKSCIDKYYVVIWSSARPENVRRMCAQLLSPEYLARVVAVWGRDRFGLTAEDYDRRTMCYKRLTRLWSDPTVAASYPRPPRTRSFASPGSDANLLEGLDTVPDDTELLDGGAWNQANTVLIDDTAEKSRSEPYNAVTLPEFAGNRDEKPGRVLAYVQRYLEALSSENDISTYIREKPFTTEQIPDRDHPLSMEYKASTRERDQSPKNKPSSKERGQSPKNKPFSMERSQSPPGMAARGSFRGSSRASSRASTPPSA